MAEPVAFVPVVVATVAIKDLKTALAWYEEKLQMPMVYAVDDIGWAEITTPVPGLTIGLSTNAAGAGVGENVVLTLGVADIDAARATLESRGVQFTGPTDELPGMVKLATFHDLDGNMFMLAQTLMQQS